MSDSNKVEGWLCALAEFNPSSGDESIKSTVRGIFPISSTAPCPPASTL